MPTTLDRSIYELQRQRALQQPASDKLKQVLDNYEAVRDVPLSELANMQNVNVGFDHYEQPRPERKPCAKLLEQAASICDCNDERLTDLINDFGGERACARMFAALWLAGSDTMLGIRLSLKR